MRSEKSIEKYNGFLKETNITKTLKRGENREIIRVAITIMDILWYVIGSTAAFLTMFGFVPQVIKIVKTNYVRDISFVMLIQISFGASLWIAYRIHISDLIVTVANIISLTTLIVVISLFFTYRSNHETDNCLS